jgi:hypothetical protein
MVDDDFEPWIVRQRRCGRPRSARCRIVVCGDSIAYGFGVAQSDSLSKQLERLLASHESVFIHNPLHPNRVGLRLAALYLLRKLIQGGFLTEVKVPAAELSPEDRALPAIIERAE